MLLDRLMKLPQSVNVTMPLALCADVHLDDDPSTPGVRSFTYDPYDPTSSLAGLALAYRKGRGDVRWRSTIDWAFI